VKAQGRSGRRRGGRWLAFVGGAGIAAAALWIAVHEVPWLGPTLAEGARALVGPGPVAWAEDVAYGAADRARLLVGGDEEAPKTYWEPPSPAAAGAPAAEVVPASTSARQAGPTPTPPPAAEPPFPRVAATGDGVWIPMAPPGAIGPPVLWKTLIHPDPKRPFAAVALVAIDRAAVDVHVVPGTDEPKKAPHLAPFERPGVVSPEHHDRLLAAFNGGFRAMHGNYGMAVGGRTILPPRDIACTIALLPGDRIAIRTWKEIASLEDEMLAYRQTPPCLIEQGKPNPGLLEEFNRNWGATVGGDTIIRRSALGLSADGRHLFYALGDAVTAQSIGRAMQVAGARDAAQLDVNYSYPKFVLFEQNPSGAPIASSPLLPDLKFSPSDYVSGGQERDFFYLTTKRQEI
jgi:hypothetical protein